MINKRSQRVKQRWIWRASFWDVGDIKQTHLEASKEGTAGESFQLNREESIQTVLLPNAKPGLLGVFVFVFSFLEYPKEV